MKRSSELLRRTAVNACFSLAGISISIATWLYQASTRAAKEGLYHSLHCRVDMLISRSKLSVMSASSARSVFSNRVHRLV